MFIQARTPLDFRRSAALAAFFSSLALGATAPPPSHAQTEPVHDTHRTDAARLSAALEGSWVRNEDLSEDPAASVAGQFASPALRQLADDLTSSRHRLLIEFPGRDVLVRNARGENLRLPTDGLARYDSAGNASNAFLAEDSLEIVTRGDDPWAWLWTETFYRQGDRLVQLTETQNFSSPDLLFRTVYDHADGRPPPWPSATARRSPAFVEPAAIRIVPPRRGYRELLAGPVQVQTLIIDPLVRSVEFRLDGARVKKSGKPPFSARIRLDDPPRPQTLEVRAYDSAGMLAGSDQVVLNRPDSPFEVRIAGIRSTASAEPPALRVTANISVPRTATLERVTFYRSDHPVATLDDLDTGANRGEARVIPVDTQIEGISPGDFVRVTAQLADGRQLEDAELLQGAEHRGEIDVQLVQLQILVVDRRGNAVGNLTADDFEIRENRAWRPPENLHASDDVPLVLGIAIDSSESMNFVWRQLHTVVRAFLEGALAEEDRAFLVDFDDTVRPLQALTGSQPLLRARLHRLLAQGGTALNDGILFSLLQFRAEPGRRALVVVTDGDDLHSRTKRAQVADFAERMGVPIYFIALGWSDPRSTLVKRLSRQTGGRLFRIHPGQSRKVLAREMQAVFDRIREDLWHQVVLTYYSDRPSGADLEPEVRTTRRGLTVKGVLPLEALQ